MWQNQIEAQVQIEYFQDGDDGTVARQSKFGRLAASQDGRPKRAIAPSRAEARQELKKSEELKCASASRSAIDLDPNEKDAKPSNQSKKCERKAVLQNGYQ